MSYLYYPGCSLKSTGRAYEESLLAVFDALKAGCQEIEDWNCCGATAYMAVDEMKSIALAARNLALAEEQTNGAGPDVMTPCNACYLVLMKAQKAIKDHQYKSDRVCDALKENGLTYTGKARIRHPLDILINDIGLDTIKNHVKKPLEGMKIASYYGCQIVRPYATFDDPHDPQTMDQVMQALGAEVIDWPLKTRCCGGSLSGTIEPVGLRLSYILLKEAKKRGADTVVTACPLCQFNLECYQDKMNEMFDDRLHLPVAYFTQLMGVAFGLPEKSLGLNRLFVPLQLPAAV